MKIIDCFGELIAYSIYLTEQIGKIQPSYEGTLKKINELINSSKNLAATDKTLADSFEQSLFAICAWLDEQILLSNWQQKEIWQLNPLQKQYFKTTLAGDQFFEVLDRFDPVLDKETIEIYNLCIKLGFQGKSFYPKTNVQVIENSSNENIKYIEYSEFTETKIFSFAYPGEVDKKIKKTSQINIYLVMLIMAIVSICGLGLVRYFYNMLLEQQLAGFFK